MWRIARDRLDEDAALLAYHWEEAGEDLEAARWHAWAARWIGLSNYTEAYAHWRRVATLIPDTEESSDAIALRVEAFRTLIALAFRIETSDDEEAAISAEGLGEASRLIDQAGAERWRPHLHVERAELHRLMGESDAARHEFAEAHRLFAAMGATGFLPTLRSA